MKIGRPLAIATIALTAFGALEPAMAQPYGPSPDRGRDRYDDGYDKGYADGYRRGYNRGFQDGRRGRRFDDRADRVGPVARTGDRDALWRARYARTYTYNDDNFYRECRQSVDPAGVIAGALIGGLLGNAVGRGSGGATFAGIVVGGVTGAALTRNLNCEDRSYAYKAYYDGFNAGRAQVTYNWRNPRNGHYGEFRVGDYYTDPDGFRCANYTQRIYIDGRPQMATGQACQQPDGTWTIVG
jgi:surface antigen